jgi:uncharacterized membrane protein YkgB
MISFIKHFILGLIISTVSFILLIRNEWLINQTGTWDWAERHLGSEGGTRLFLKLISIFGMIIGFLVMTGMYQQFLRWLIGPLFKISY